MPRIPVHTVANAPDAARDTLRVLESTFGKVLNIHGEMAHAPVVLAAYTGITAAIGDHGTFDARTREAIALAVGAVDACEYCQSAHTIGARAAGWSLEQTVSLRSAAPIDGDTALTALLALAREIAGNVGTVGEDTWSAALSSDWTVHQLAELFAHVAVNLFTNYFNHYAHTALDLPAAPPLGGTR
ncbi:carboxymuconolactone decarboxylase family protein [Rhodococcus ruber]|uniref:carboxymuconolactone decarboxylase family protein n=1 Tax=Rhodococcus ruber TaxID=1830 RepID=UPI00177A9758|nr:carboxymuconolactone decarboxylase family protein [Rhodococcus ruber]MBD8057164.1 carboxymuconolactone decarboxylase family protein [Rhodococcus ruber]